MTPNKACPDRSAKGAKSQYFCLPPCTLASNTFMSSSAPSSNSKLSIDLGNPVIVDVGANNGDDSDFYLAKGFSVIAIEADPELAAALRERFAEAVEAHRCVVQNVAISEAQGPITFFKNAFSEWSSIRRDSKATQRHSHQEIMVPGDTLSAILYPVPLIHYLKIDIEGGELPAVASLKGIAERVRYLSFEINPDWEQILELVDGYGFQRFKLIRQGRDYLQPPPMPAREGDYVATRFKNSMSGTFGEELPGEWISLEELRRAVVDCLQAMQERSSRGEPPGWYDVHATR